MTVQITVRLPDENVAWLDAEVAAGRFPSRTAGLAKLLTKAQRRQEDEADMLKILASTDPDDESRLEWMRTRQFPLNHDGLSYPDDQHAVTAHDLGATREPEHTGNAPAASTAARARSAAADSVDADRTSISK